MMILANQSFRMIKIICDNSKWQQILLESQKVSKEVPGQFPVAKRGGRQRDRRKAAGRRELQARDGSPPKGPTWAIVHCFPISLLVTGKISSPGLMWSCERLQRTASVRTLCRLQVKYIRRSFTKQLCHLVDKGIHSETTFLSFNKSAIFLFVWTCVSYSKPSWTALMLFVNAKLTFQLSYHSHSVRSHYLGLCHCVHLISACPLSMVQLNWI